MKSASAIGWSDVADREATLIQRAVAGDETACAELLSQHERMVYQLALNLLGDHNEALDVSQEVFLQVFRTLHRFGGRSTLRTWIYRIVVNQARNHQRWWRRRRRAEQVSLDEHIRMNGDPPTDAAQASPDRVLSRKELAVRVRTALSQLPFGQRTALVLREVDGLSYEEIAYSLGVGLGAVKSRLARARESLRTQLREA